MAKVTAVTTVLLYTGLPRFLLGPKTQMMSEPKRCFTVGMPDCCVNLLFLPREHSFPGGWWFAGWSQESSPTIGRCAVQKHPPTPPPKHRFRSAVSSAKRDSVCLQQPTPPPLRRHGLICDDDEDPVFPSMLGPPLLWSRV